MKHITKKTKLAGKILVLPLIASISSASAFADSEKKINWLEDAKKIAREYVEAEAKIESRISSLEDGESVLVYDPTVGVNVKIMKEGCLTLKTTASTHDKDSDNNFYDPTLNSGILDGSHSDIGAAVNDLYVESDCLLNRALKLQAGAMSTQSDGSMGIDNDGFMDAIKATYKTDIKALASISGTYGRLDTEADVNVFDREYDDIDDNFKQITIMGAAGPVAYAGEFTRLNDTDYIRASASVAISVLFKFMDNVRVEVLSEDEDIVGTEYSASSKSFANGTKFIIGYRDLEDGTSLPIDEKKLQDKVVFVKLVKQVTKKCHVGLGLQNGEELGARIDAEGVCRF